MTLIINEVHDYRSSLDIYIHTVIHHLYQNLGFSCIMLYTYIPKIVEGICLLVVNRLSALKHSLYIFFYSRYFYEVLR